MRELDPKLHDESVGSTDRATNPMRAALHRSAEPPLPMGVVVRRLRPDDASALGSLMVSAYAGTVDDHGEPPEFAASEARRTIAGEYGAVEWDASPYERVGFRVDRSLC